MIKSFFKFISIGISSVGIAFILIISYTASAQEPQSAHPAVWLIETENSKTYFLGSIHMLPKEIGWFDGEIKSIFESADEVVFEVHMTPQNQALAGMMMRDNGILPAGDLLSNYLEPADYKQLIEQATTLGMPEGSIAVFKPWFASIVLSVSAIINQGWDPDSGVDKYIEKLATDKGITISELESLDAQMETLYDHPLDVQAEMLKDTLEQLQEIEQLTMDMVSSWAAGDVEKMKEVFLTPMQQQREIYRKLVVQRNQNWLPVIDGLIAKNQTTFVVAGAAHFIGEDGLVKLLEDKGYTVNRVQ